MATRGRSAVFGTEVLHVKGAPEVVLERCHRVVTDSGAEPIANHKAAIAAAFSPRLQARGQRTMGWPTSEAPPGGRNGRVGRAADVARVRDGGRPGPAGGPGGGGGLPGAGIAVKMVTGDGPGTAAEIARQIGIVGDAGPAR